MTANPPFTPSTAKKTILIGILNARILLPLEIKPMLADNLCNPGATGPVYQETMHALSRTQTVCPSTKTSGEEKCGLHVSGIVIQIANCVMSWRPFSAGLCHLRLTAKPFPISLISTYNHTEDLDACVKETFDIHVNDLVDLIPKKLPAVNW